ncbi:HNH endonuclease [Paenibacillus peoriae]|uniref:HNH endonuclease n=1 Tax=Paenibacillus peoriae TaxID=59893 RepID=A0A7H0Y1P3_9BACL|nr:HNH endonuclease [Paenibacillus peoriae]QNR65001.1 HNH endonuclease [Paenibacillus peoriae]
MRSILKSDKPEILIEKEKEWHDELMQYVKQGAEIPSTVAGRYRHSQIKKALLSETGDKCVYCESKLTHIDYGDIEHILPKSIFRELTFSWDNLTIGCAKCNKNKDIYYNPKLPLLNPYIDEPEKCITFIGAIPYPTNGNDRAEITIMKLKLDRSELVERRDEHIKKLSPLFKQFHRTQDLNLKQLLLDDLMEYTKPDKEFSLLTKQVLENLKITG